MNNKTIRARIEQFVSVYPDGPLFVAVGYASANGVAWLQRIAPDRPVRLLIGHPKRKWWTNASDQNARRAERFIRRSDTEVRNWYRTGKSKHGAAAAHLKVWIIRPPGRGPSALVGSANLTGQGLDTNVEVLVEAMGSDLDDTVEKAEHLWRQAWDCSEPLLGYLPQRPSQSQPKTRPAHQSHLRSSQRSQRPSQSQPSDGLVAWIKWKLKPW